MTATAPEIPAILARFDARTRPAPPVAPGRAARPPAHVRDAPLRSTADLARERRARMASAVHEAGHAVAVVLAGGHVVETRLVEGDPNVGGLCTHEGVPDAAESGITYAGPWAEARWQAGRVPPLRDIAAVLAANRSDDASLTAAGGPLPRRVEPHLERAWPSILTVARAITATPITHDTVRAALGLSANPATAATELAIIRSGRAPRTFAVNAVTQ